MIADRLEASLCQADSVDVDALVTGPNTLTVDGLRVSGALRGVSNTSCDEVEVGGARQWAGVFLQTFDDVDDATSWHGGLSKSAVLLSPQLNNVACWGCLARSRGCASHSGGGAQ